jgi:hypothetical protein
MAYYAQCGAQLVEGAKFCQKCGSSVHGSNAYTSQRQQEFAGKVYKCPQCGEVLNSFEINCPSCGYELRGAKASNAVREFALKLEAIESQREFKQSRSLKSRMYCEEITKTDEQKISLIRSFAIPNTKEDLYEFLILAGSNIDVDLYDGTVLKTDARLAVSDAWKAKYEQAYQKAKILLHGDQRFSEIQSFYTTTHKSITRARGKLWRILGVELSLIFGIIIALAIILTPLSKKEETAELERLDSIVLDIQEALENEEYSHALRIADSIDYQRYDVEMERKWDLEKEYWVEKVLAEAAKHGVDLEYTPSTDIDNANDDLEDESGDNTINSGFIKGFIDGLKSSIDDAED